MKTDTRLDTSVRSALARAIGDRDVPDDVVQAVSDHLVTLSKPGPVRKFDICTHGLCVDYLVDVDKWEDLLRDVRQLDLPIRAFHGFPWGVIADDLVQIRVELELEALAEIRA